MTELKDIYIISSLFAIFCFSLCVFLFVLWLKAKQKLHQLEKDYAILEFSNQTIKQQIEDTEKLKQEHLNITKASILEVSNSISSKLIDDHKRESEAQKKQTEEKIKQTTEDLFKNFQGVFEKVKSLNDRVDKSENIVQTVKNSLLNPQSSGVVGEIILENILKNSGLKKDRDYFLQFSFKSEDNSTLRPDAIIHLPGNSVIVIDSKSSKYLIDFDSENQVELEKNFKTSLTRQLNNLTSKDYAKQIASHYKQTTNNEPSVMHTVMFLPTDNSLDRAQNLDANFTEKALSKNVIPVGPSGLISLLIQSKVFIDRAIQYENYEHILAEVKKIIENVAKLHSNIETLGKSMHSGLQKFNSLANSFNKTITSKKDSFVKLGVGSESLKNIETIELYELNKSKTIENQDL